MPYRLIKELKNLEALPLGIDLEPTALLTDFNVPLSDAAIDQLDLVLAESKVLFSINRAPTVRQKAILKECGYTLETVPVRGGCPDYYIHTSKGKIELNQ